MLLFLALLQGNGDDSTWINEGIRAAISQGQSSYSIPAGNYSVANPIVIPAGTKNFALLGAGSDKTIITSLDPAMAQAIKVGVLPQLHDNWMITGACNIPVQSVSAGSSTLTLATPTPTLASGYFVLWDDYRVICAKGPNSVMNHAELVRETSYDPTTGKVQLDVPVGRDYGPNTMICPYDGAVCSGIRVAGFGFQGSTSDGLLAVGICDGVQVQDLAAQGFRSDAVMTNTSRHVTMDGVSVSCASDGGAGSGYGISIYRSRFVKVTNCHASDCRHGFLVHAGSMDVTFANCSTTCGFDLHGFDERRVVIADCSGDGGDIGNDAWLAGAKDIVILRCKFTDPFGFHANVRSIRVADSQLGGVGVYSAEAGTTPTIGVPAEGMVDDVRFDRCTLRGTGYTLFWEDGATRMGNVLFNNCTFENSSTSWGTCLDVGHISGQLTLESCKLAVDSTDHVVQVANSGLGYCLVMQHCSLLGSGGLGVWVKSVFAGYAFLRNNVYGGIGFPPAFVCDDSGHVMSLRNTAYSR